MKFEEVKDAFMKGRPIKRKDWDRFIVYIPRDSLNMECVVADDWEIMPLCHPFSPENKNNVIDSIIAELQRLKD